MQGFSTLKYFLNLYNDPKISAWSILVKDRVTEIGYLSVQPKSFLNRAFSSFHFMAQIFGKYISLFISKFLSDISVLDYIIYMKKSLIFSSKLAKKTPIFLYNFKTQNFGILNPSLNSSRHFIQFRGSCPLSSTLYLDEQKTVIEKTK